MGGEVDSSGRWGRFPLSILVMKKRHGVGSGRSRVGRDWTERNVRDAV